MPFSNKDKALIKRTYTSSKNISSQRILTEFWKINFKRKRLGKLLKRLWKQEAPTKGI